MMFKYLFGWFLITLICCPIAWAQEVPDNGQANRTQGLDRQEPKSPSDSTYRLPFLLIGANRLQYFTTGNKIVVLDSALVRSYATANLADLLTDQSQIFIKSYGQGSLATSSFRGSGASHTAVLWNGFNLQSPMSGQLDLALVPVVLLDDVQLQYGGSGALFGSGAVGGTIHLNNSTPFNQGVKLGISQYAGSFDSYQTGINLSYSGKKWTSSTRLFLHNAQNNFPFDNTAEPGHPRIRQSHAALSQTGVLQENQFKLNSRQQLRLRLWYQKNDRDIPPPMTTASNQSHQQDEFYRLTLDWQRAGFTTGKIRADWYARTAYFDERLIFNKSYNHSWTSITEVESKISIGQLHSFNAGLNHTYNQALSDGYPYRPTQHRTSLFASYKWHNRSEILKAVLSVREELIAGKMIPLTPSIGVEYVPTKDLSLKGNAARIYRLPTFNDLYWRPGGDPGLLPESGWSQELGITYQPSIGSVRSRFNLTGYSSRVDQWIIWLPHATTGNWSPQNLLAVWARGLEGMARFHWEMHPLQVGLEMQYSYVRSTGDKAAPGNESSLHRQLLYVPQHSGNINCTVAYQGFQLRYGHSYTGIRYTTTDESQWLSPYQLGNVTLSKSFPVQKTFFHVLLRANNVWGESYQVIAWRAMPLSNYQVGISWQYHRTNL